MKKIILILFLFILFYSCYFIYKKTEKSTLYVMSMGDTISNIKLNDSQIEEYNTSFVNKDNRIIDILNTIKYNKELVVNNKSISIHQIIRKSDIIIISIGMNDIYYKLENNPKEIYTYLNNMILDYEEILKEINKYNNKKIFILGYYNITNKQNDIFAYANYKLEKITNKYNYIFINLNEKFHNNPEYLLEKGKFYLNNKGISKINNFIVENLKKY